MRKNGWPVQPHPARRICRSCAKSRIHMLALAIDQIHQTLTALDNRQRFAIRAPRRIDGTRVHGGPFLTAFQCAYSCQLSSGFRQTLLNVYLSTAYPPVCDTIGSAQSCSALANRLNLFSHFVKLYIRSATGCGFAAYRIKQITSPRFHYSSSNPNAVCKLRTASSVYSASIKTDILISDVEMT